MRIELRTAPGCPNAETARTILTECLTALGINGPIIELVGHYPSPTVLIDGVDVMHPNSAPANGDACRLDLPTPHFVLNALQCGLAERTRLH